MNERKVIFGMLAELKPEFDFTTSKDFISDGYLDSFDIISLTSMLEEKFHIKIDGLDILPENYDSVEHLIGLVKKNGGKVE